MRIYLSQLCIATLFTSLVYAQDSPFAQQKGSSEEYIIKKDSSKIIGNVKEKKGKVWVDGTGYEYSDLVGFKEGKHYHAVINGQVFWVFALGKIQAYMKWVQTGANSNVALGYLRKGNGELIGYTTVNLHNLIQDNAEAVSEFNKYFSKINDKAPVDLAFRKLQKVLAVYNSSSVQNF